jgi:hypothetical protein
LHIWRTGLLFPFQCLVCATNFFLCHFDSLSLVCWRMASPAVASLRRVGHQSALALLSSTSLNQLCCPAKTASCHNDRRDSRTTTSNDSRFSFETPAVEEARQNTKRTYNAIESPRYCRVQVTFNLLSIFQKKTVEEHSSPHGSLYALK